MVAIRKMYQVYLKSHCEYPDFEAEYNEGDLENGCPINYTDDGDDGGECGGELETTTEKDMKCKRCGADFYYNPF